MTGAGEHLGQMGLVILTQRDWPLQLCSSSVTGSSSPSPCRLVSILPCDRSRDEDEDWSSHFYMNIFVFSPSPCQMYVMRPTSRSNI